MPDYTYTIKTPAELAGVEQAIERFERLRGAAKANGKDFTELDQKIAAAKASIEAFQAAQQKLAASTAQLADESERYQATLKKQADAAKDAADAEALAALKSEASAKAAARKQVEIEEAIYAQSELANLTKTYSQAEIDATLNVGAAHDKAAEATDKHEANARKVDKAFGALAASGGPVGRTLNLLRELAGSPLTLGLAGLSIVVGIIAQKFGEWREEIQQTRARLMEMEWGRLDGLRTALSNAATAQNELNTALAAAGKNNDELGTAYSQRATVLDAEIERKKNLLKLNEELEVSNARAAGGGDADEKSIRNRYAAARAGFESNAGAARVQELQNELAQREGRQPGLITAAQSSRAAVDQFAASKQVIDANTRLGQEESKARAARDKFTAAGGQSQLDKLEKLFAAMDPEGELAGGIARDLVPLRKLKQQVDAANAELFGAQGQVDANTRQQAGLESSAGAAQAAATSNAEAITGLRTRIATAGKVNDIQSGQRRDELAFGQGAPGKTIFDAAAGADAIAGGGAASPEQAAAMNKLIQQYNLRKLGTDRIIELLGTLNDNDATLLQAIETLKVQAKQNQSDAQSKLQQSFNR